MQHTAYRGEMLYDEPLSGYTTWRVGGPARRLYRPADSDDLVQFLQSMPADEPLLWLGLGSNLLVRDGGFNGTVILTRGQLDSIEMLGGSRVRVEAGVSSAKLARIAVFFFMLRGPPWSRLFRYTGLFRSMGAGDIGAMAANMPELLCMATGDVD